MILRDVAKAVLHCISFVRYYGVAIALREAGPYFREMRSKRERNAEVMEAFDAEFGTDTTLAVMPWELSDLPQTAEIHPYHSLTADAISSAIRRLSLPYNSFVFVDLGAGKGRPLLVASQFQFKKVIGVELSGVLTDIARANIEIYKARRGSDQDFNLVHSDAAKFQFPADPLLLFMYNPFGPATMRAVIENLRTSFSERPRAIYIVYFNPVFRALLDDTSFLCCVFFNEDYAIYCIPDHHAGTALLG